MSVLTEEQEIQVRRLAEVTVAEAGIEHCKLLGAMLDLLQPMQRRLDLLELLLLRRIADGDRRTR